MVTKFGEGGEGAGCCYWLFGPVRPRRGSYAGATYLSFEAHRGGYEARGGGEFETRGGFEQRGEVMARGNYEPRAYARRGRAFGRDIIRGI